MGLFTKDVWVACQSTDNVYYFDSGNSYLSTIKVAGDGPYGVAVDMRGNVWVTNQYSNTVSMYNAKNNYSRVDYSIGASPHGVAVDYEGNVYIACTNGNTQYPDGCLAILNVNNAYSISYVGTYYHPFGVTVDDEGNVWISHPERKVETDEWTISSFNKSLNFMRTDYVADKEPTGIVSDSVGNIWVACQKSSDANGVVLKFVKSGSYSKLSYNTGARTFGIAVDVNGFIWATNITSGTVSRITPGDGSVVSYNCNGTPCGISVDKDNNIWIANRDSSKITKLNNADYSTFTQYDVGSYVVSFGDMTGTQISQITNHYKYLVVNSGALKTWNGTAWVNVGSGTIPTLADFNNNGFLKLEELNDSSLSLLPTSDFDVLVWSDKVGKTYSTKTTALPNEKLILQNGDISIETIESIQDINIVGNITGSGAKFRIIVSVDSGTTWKTFDGASWNTIAATTTDVLATGITLDNFNNITTSEWNALVSGKTLLRFGYYLDINDLSDKIEMEQLNMFVNIKGYWKKASDTEHTYEFRSMTELKVFLKASGNYKLNYIIMKDPASPDNGDGWQQIDVIAPAGTSSSAPHIVEVTIPYTTDFKRKEPNVLKFVPGTQNVVRTSCEFNASDNTKFTVLEDGAEVPAYQSKYITFDGTMHFKTSYSFTMNDEGPLGDGRMFSIQIVKSPDGTPTEDQYLGVVDPSNGGVYKFKDITGMSVS